MHGKEFAIDVIRTYFAVVTLINLIMCVMGMQFNLDNRFGYEGFATPLFYGAAGTLPNIVMYSKRELAVKELLIRKVIQLILIEIIVLFVVFYNAEAFLLQPEIIIGVGISVLAIYLITSVIDGVQNHVSAKKMTEELMKFQESVRE